MGIVVEGKGLTKRFGEGEAGVVAVDSVDITIQESELVMLMGDSGCGKTTLISLLGCILTPSEGELWIDGKQINHPDQDLSVIRREKIGFVFQLFHLLPYLTALENVIVAMDLAGKKSDQAENRAKELLAQVGLGDRLGHRPSQLSGGEKQRVSFARALANNPKIVFADEPTANLDSRQSETLMGLVREPRAPHNNRNCHTPRRIEKRCRPNRPDERRPDCVGIKGIGNEYRGRRKRIP